MKQDINLDDFLPKDDEMVFNNIEDLSAWYGCGSAGQLIQAMFDSTACGLCYSEEKNCVTLSARMEEEPSWSTHETLYFPFSSAYLQEMLAMLRERVEAVRSGYRD